MKPILHMLRDVTVEDLAQAAITLSQFCKDPHFIAEQKKQNLFHKVMNILPSRIANLILAVYKQEIELICQVKHEMLQKGQDISNLGIDDVMAALYARMPPDLRSLDYTLSSKVNVLCQMIRDSFGTFDVINKQILQPLEKIENTIQAKRQERIGLRDVNNNIDALVKKSLDELKVKYGFLEKEAERVRIGEALGIVIDRIAQLKGKDKETVALLEEEKKRLMARRQVIIAELANIEKHV